jgi:hypothetical protein
MESRQAGHQRRMIPGVPEIGQARRVPAACPPVIRQARGWDPCRSTAGRLSAGGTGGKPWVTTAFFVPTLRRAPRRRRRR